MRLFCKDINDLFDTLVLILNTEEILLYIPEFEKLVRDENYTVETRFEDSDDKRMKNMIFRIYDREKLSEYDEQTKNIILEKI